MNTTNHPTRVEIENASRHLVNASVAHKGTFGAQRAARRLAVSAAARQLAEAIVINGFADEKTYSTAQASLADLIEIEAEICRKNRERFRQ